MMVGCLRPADHDGSGVTAPRLAGVVLSAIVATGCSGSGSSVTSRQDAVESRGAAMMPFDQRRTTHVFRTTANGRGPAGRHEGRARPGPAPLGARSPASGGRSLCSWRLHRSHGHPRHADAGARPAAPRRLTGDRRLLDDPAWRADQISHDGARTRRRPPRVVRRAAHGPRRQRARLRPSTPRRCRAAGRPARHDDDRPTGARLRRPARGCDASDQCEQVGVHTVRRRGVDRAWSPAARRARHHEHRSAGAHHHRRRPDRAPLRATHRALSRDR